MKNYKKVNQCGAFFFKKQLRGNWRQLVKLVSLALLNTGSKITLAYAMGWFINGAVARRMLSVWAAGGVALLSLILGYGLTITLSATQLEMTKQMQQSLKAAIYQVIFYRDVQETRKFRWQNIFNLTENSVPTVASDYFGNNLANIGRVIQISLCSLALLVINIEIFGLFVVVSAIPFFLNPVIRRQFGRYKAELNEKNMAHMSLMTNVLKGLTTIRAFSGGAIFNRQLKAMDEQLEEQRKRSKLWDIRIGQLSTLLAMSAQIICMLIAAFFVLNRMISIGNLIVTTQLLNFIVPTITAFNTAYLIGRATLPLRKECDAVLRVTANSASRQFINGDIVVSHLSYAYPQNAPLFTDLEVTFASGKKTAVIGESGCGKSTLMRLVAGELTDYQGSVTIGGQAITTIDPRQFHRHVIYVNQTPVIFAGTVLENITLFGTPASPGMANILWQLKLTHLVQRHVENGDVELSGGERQRISLARALLVQAPVLMIDEPDSGQDPASARTIQQLIFKLKDRTVVVVTHNWEATYLKRFDQVIRL